jgi:C4-dicarboxylate-specific signal transduction histidine kinase
LLEKPLRNLERATSREFDAVSGDLELYRTLATIGTTTAVMAHEATNPPNTIIKAAQSVRKRGRKLLPDRYEKQLAEPVDLIESSARRLTTLIELPRRLLDRTKRRRGTFDVNGVITESLSLLSPLVNEHQVAIETDLDRLAPKYVGTVAALESIIANLIINAVNALNETTQPARTVRVQTATDGSHVTIDVADNGPGIRNIEVKDIWLPGRGTSQRGVGLGLTIVRDIVGDLNGMIEAKSVGELGGAQFTVTIPNAAD